MITYYIIMLPNVLSPNSSSSSSHRLKYDGVAWFYGLDPAVKVDSFGIVIHGLFPKPDARDKSISPEWNPFLREVFEIKHDNFTEIITWINTVLIPAYPPRFAIIDATRDTPTAQELEKKYGETRFKAMAMTNSLNYEMKQLSYAFLEQGYSFPNTSIMKNKEKARAIAELKVQILHERIEWTADNRPKFSHPPGKHNDLDRAWEMSLKAVRDFQMGKIGHARKIRPDLKANYDGVNNDGVISSSPDDEDEEGGGGEGGIRRYNNDDDDDNDIDNDDEYAMPTGSFRMPYEN